MAWDTHEIFNQVDERRGFNLFTTHPALQEAVHAAGADWAEPQLAQYGREIGSEHMFEQAALANTQLPEFRPFDARGRRIDAVSFHPAWHTVMAQLRGGALVSLALRDTRPGRWVANMAGFYMHCEVESGR